MSTNVPSGQISGSPGGRGNDVLFLESTVLTGRVGWRRERKETWETRTVFDLQGVGHGHEWIGRRPDGRGGEGYVEDQNELLRRVYCTRILWRQTGVLHL